VASKKLNLVGSRGTASGFHFTRWWPVADQALGTGDSEYDIGTTI
jgi:hypothetical protein